MSNRAPALLPSQPTEVSAIATPVTKSLRASVVDRNKRNSGHLALADRPYRMTRKRAASLIESVDNRQDDDGDGDGDDEPGPNSGESSSHVCLCQPEPKIPRPRNAFILYRQHFQASVVFKNPGLANPEISKIIGERWRAEPQVVKDEWKSLAENEKVQHSQKYPDYRYQPRRNGVKGRKPTSALGSPQDSPACVKCGGKSLSSSSTPLTPYLPENPQLQSAFTPNTSRHSSGPSSRYNPSMDLSIATPHPASQLRLNLPPRELSAVKLGGDHDLDGGSSAVVSRSELKRRRLNNSSPPPRQKPSILPPVPHSRRMEPPPHPESYRHHDSSLILPPLQTAYTRSVEAMVMTIPFLNKIKVLYKISSPLSTPGPTSPIHNLRGAIIAVEGGDRCANTTVMKLLDQHLQKMGEYQIKTVQAESSAFEGENSEETQNSLYIRYLKSISEWHIRSQGLIKYITTGTFPEETPISETANPQPAHDPMQIDGITAQASATQTNMEAKARLPIVLIDRYILSRSDEAASTIPINDRYAPVDHWQWMATLWRGIVGPDITVYVRECSREEIDELGGLEISKEFPPNALVAILRRYQGKGVEEKLVRRLSFEISEWLRGSGHDGLHVRGDVFR